MAGFYENSGDPSNIYTPTAKQYADEAKASALSAANSDVDSANSAADSASSAASALSSKNSAASSATAASQSANSITGSVATCAASEATAVQAASDASTSANESAVSAGQALSSASSASSSASSAASSAGSASSSKTSAQSSANNAASSASSALAAATSAANSASDTVTQPLTAHGSMFEPDASNDLTTPATVANQFTVKAGQYRVNGTLIDLPSTVITLPAAPSTAALLSRKDLTYLKEDGTIGIFEGLDDNPTMEQAGFTAVSGEKGLYVNGGVYATALFAVQRRNQGAHHPAFNEWGTNPWREYQGGGSTRFWHTVDEPSSITSIGDCFDSTWIKDRAYIASGTSGRPDSKFYDAIYTSDILDLRLQAKAPSATQLEPNYWQNKAVAGTLKNFANEGVPKLVVKERGVVETLGTNASTEAITIGSTAIAGISLGDFVVVLTERGALVHSGYVSDPAASSIAIRLATSYSAAINGDRANFSRTNGDIYTILKVEYTEATGSENTWTDIIGDPANYPRQWTGVIDSVTSSNPQFTDVGLTTEVTELTSGSGVIGNVYLNIGGVAGATVDLRVINFLGASGWLDLGTKAEFLANATGVEGFPLLYGENGESLIPDGTSKEYKMSRKASNSLGQIHSDDSGVSWSFSDTWDADIAGSANRASRTVSASRVLLQNYQTPAHIFSDDVNSEVLGGKLGDVFGNNYNEVRRGGLLSSSLIGKVPVMTNATNNGSFVYTPVTTWQIDSINNKLTTYSKPFHSGVDLNTVGGGSPAVKSLPYLHTDNNEAQLNVLFKEMVYDSGADSMSDVTRLTTVLSFRSTPANTLVFFENAPTEFGDFAGRFFITTGIISPTLTKDNFVGDPVTNFVLFEKPNGEVWLTSPSNSSSYANFKAWDGNGWGDDNTFTVVDNTATDVDSNANTILVGTKSTKLPIITGEG